MNMYVYIYIYAHMCVCVFVRVCVCVREISIICLKCIILSVQGSVHSYMYSITFEYQILSVRTKKNPIYIHMLGIEHSKQNSITCCGKPTLTKHSQP